MTDVSSIYLPVPDDLVQQVHRFAHDLAWGAVHQLWLSNIGRNQRSTPQPSSKPHWIWSNDELQAYVDHVWDGLAPDLMLLESFGYLDSRWVLTNRAFDLLVNRPTSIFISYRRAVSSALAMLIAAELRLVGFQPFIDIQDIPLGDKWHALVEKRVRDSNIFIIVIGPATLDSTYVRKEIEWALENEQSRRIIPILHSGFSEAELAAVYPTLQQNNLIRIQSDRATDFYAALQLLKNALGV